MRKIIVSLNTTLDGFMAGKHCELDWHFKYWDDEMAGHASNHLKNADTILLGRITYQAMSQYWPSRSVELNTSREDLGFADMMNSYQKIVCSRTLESPGWQRSSILRSATRLSVTRLKQQPGKNIIVYGSGALVSQLMSMQLVDELILWLHPVILVEGKPAFRRGASTQSLMLSDVQALRSGVLLSRYCHADTADTHPFLVPRALSQVWHR